MKLKRSEDNWCWVNFKYEAVPTFCFICGLIGHNEKFCDRIFDTPVDQIEKPYGTWMKAEPKRRNYTMGAQWLRQGGKIPATFPVKDSGVSQGKASTVIGADRILNLEISAIGREIRGDNVRERISGDHGIAGTIDFQNGQRAGDFLTIENERENYSDLESNGLVVTDPKRKRVDEPVSYGLKSTQNTNDIYMSESQNNDQLVSKNEEMAGAALQPRQSL